MSSASVGRGIGNKEMGMNSKTQRLFEEVILENSESNRYRGALETPTYRQRERNAACGDWVQLDLLVDAHGQIQQARFQGRGCMISQAAASLLCEYAQGKGLEDLEGFTAADMLKLLRVSLAPRRLQCGLLPFRAIKTIVYSADDGLNVRNVPTAGRAL